MLTVEKLGKRFGGLDALKDISFDIPKGKVTSIIGPNGAGKTTLFNVVSGDIKPTEGAVKLKGIEVTGWDAHRVCELGLARTFQTPRLFENLSVLENVLTARFVRTRSTVVESILGFPRSRLEHRRDMELAEELLRSVEIWQHQTRMPNELPYGDKRRLEIARALATEPDLLLMDEPTAGMINEESEELMALIRVLTGTGRTIMLIEHNMGVVMSVSDKIIVLNFGRKIAEGTPAQVQANSAVLDAYLGED